MHRIYEIVAESEALTLGMKRLLPARPALVFEFVHRSEPAGEVVGPEGFSTPNLEFDPVPGEFPDRDAARRRATPSIGLGSSARSTHPPVCLHLQMGGAHPDDVETL